MKKCKNISPYMRRPLDIYDYATAPLWISEFPYIWGNFYFLFSQCKVAGSGGSLHVETFPILQVEANFFLFACWRNGLPTSFRQTPESFQGGKFISIFEYLRCEKCGRQTKDMFCKY
jgi:hypothetical protein